MGGQCHTCGRRNRSGKNQASASPSPVAERFRHDVIDQRLRQPREFELLEDRDQECLNLLLEIDPDLLRREAETASWFSAQKGAAPAPGMRWPCPCRGGAGSAPLRGIRISLVR